MKRIKEDEVDLAPAFPSPHPALIPDDGVSSYARPTWSDPEGPQKAGWVRTFL